VDAHVKTLETSFKKIDLRFIDEQPTFWHFVFVNGSDPPFDNRLFFESIKFRNSLIAA